MIYPKEHYADILKRAQKNVSPEMAKGEGTLIFNALSAIALELERLYVEIAYISEQAHADTADFEHLKRIAADRGLVARAATACEVSAVANVPLSIGARFNFKAFNYVVVAGLTDKPNSYRLRCEEPGSSANGMIGDLTPIDYIEGLVSCRILETLIPGEDAETRDSLFARYLKSFSAEAFGGNVAQYVTEIKRIAGVGGVKIYPAYAGGGTVKAVVQAADYGVPSDFLVKQIQETLCPVPKLGYGLAPIGHDFTAEAVRERSIAVVLQVTTQKGVSPRDIQPAVQARVEEYFLNLRKSWEMQDIGQTHGGLTVYISKLEAMVLDVSGVVDASGTQLNGEARNLELQDTEIPVLKGVSIS